MTLLCSKFEQVYLNCTKYKALHSELLAELLGRFSSQNEYFWISAVRIVRHFFEVFGKFGISKFLKFPKNQFPKFLNFFRNYRTFSELFTELFQTFWPKNRVFCPKTSNFTSFFWNFQNFRIITKLFTKLEFPNFFPNFFAKIPRVRKFQFFPKNFRTSKTEHFRNSRKRKVRKFPSNAGP